MDCLCLYAGLSDNEGSGHVTRFQQRHGVDTVEDPVIEGQDKSKVKVVVPGANVQTPELATTARGKATYASVLRQPGHACANAAVKWKSEFTD
jgi:hypothetical protein